MKKKELLAKIEDLESTVQRLRSNIDMQDVLIRQFQEREHKVIDTALDLSCLYPRKPSFRACSTTLSYSKVVSRLFS